MDKGAFAAAELFVFLGLAAWLVYYQFSSSRRDSSDSSSGRKDESESHDQ